MYGSNSPDYPYVKQVYNTSADQFLNIVLAAQANTGVGPLPGSFAGGAKIINNSYVGYEVTTSAYLDDDRRLDYMINRSDVVWTAGAVTGGANFSQTQYLAWSNYNALAVSGIQNSQQNFNPTGSPGKQHADLSLPSMDSSYATAVVSGDAAALWGNAEVANQADAQHSMVMRSLLMTGADKNTYGPAQQHKQHHCRRARPGQRRGPTRLRSELVHPSGRREITADGGNRPGRLASRNKAG